MNSNPKRTRQFFYTVVSFVMASLLLVACGGPQFPEKSSADAQTKKAALINPFCIPKIETCNGKDDDCDGLIDEGLGQVICTNTACNTFGYQVCSGGTWSACSAQGPALERCNRRDDDCNGLIDDDLYRPCKTQCGKGTQVCRNGVWDTCSARQPADEICGNDIDEDCDGTLNNGCG